MKKILVVLVLFLFGTVGMVAPAAAQRPALVSPVLRFSDQNGVPLAFGQLFSYQAGTTTPLSTYVDSTTGALNTNPIVLDATGSTTVFLGANVYKFVLKDANGVIQWTADNIAEGMFQSSYVTSFNTRTGQVTSQTGDYTCAQVTGCISSIPTLYNQTIQVSGSSLPQEPALNLIPGVYGSVTSATVTAGGTLYTGAPTVTFTGGSCTALPTGSSTVAGGAVTAVVMVTLGSGCTSAPTIAFSGGGGSGAAATANLIPSGITCVDQAGVSTNCTFVAGTGSGGGSGTSVVTNVTGSRAFGVTYQNTNTVPLLVMVTGSLWLDVGHLASIQARFGVLSPDVIGPTAAIMNSDGENSVTFLVPAGDFYGVYTNNGYPGEHDSATLLNWVEGTLPLGGSGGGGVTPSVLSQVVVGTGAGYTIRQLTPADIAPAFSATFGCTPCAAGPYETGYAGITSASGTISYANPTLPTSASVSDGTNVVTLTTPFTSWTESHTYLTNTTFTLTAVGASQTVTPTQSIVFLPRTFAGPGTGTATGATASGTNAVLAGGGSSGTLTNAGLGTTYAGQTFSLTLSAQYPYLLLTGGCSHVISVNGFTTSFTTTSLTFTNQYSASIAGMCLYQGPSTLTGTYSVVVTSL